MTKQQGFTLIELLVVLAIIVMLSTLAAVSYSSVRQSSRESNRIAEIKQLQTALDMYLNDNNLYPVAASSITLGAGGGDCSSADCDTLSKDNGFADTAAGTVYMDPVPSAPTPVDGTCTAAQNAYEYTSANGSTYSITFCLGQATGGLTAGVHTASPAGIQ